MSESIAPKISIYMYIKRRSIGSCDGNDLTPMLRIATENDVESIIFKLIYN